MTYQGACTCGKVFESTVQYEEFECHDIVMCTHEKEVKEDAYVSFFRNLGLKGQQLYTMAALRESNDKAIAFDDSIVKRLKSSDSIPFGKHKGKTISKLPMDYIQWFAKNIKNYFIDEDSYYYEVVV